MSMCVEHVAVAALRPAKRNPRTHAPDQIRRIMASIKRFGFNTPIAVDADNAIIAGHGRWEAAKKLGLADVPCIRLSHLSPAECRAYLLADNRTAELAGWNMQELAIELSELTAEGFEVEATGFELPEIDVILAEVQERSPKAADKLDKIPALQPDHVVSRRGDLWRLNRHRLICGDAKSTADHNRLMGWEMATAIFTDPPCNVGISSVVGSGKRKHREFAEASGEMTSEEFVTFLSLTLGNAVRHVRSGSICFVMMDWRHMAEMLQAGENAFDTLKNVCVWAKTNAGMGSLYRSQHELAFVYKVGTEAHINNIELGRHGRHRSNVWQYAGVNSFRAGRLEELSSHPTVKPVALVADAIRDVTNRGDIVLDPFGGSGTTLIAAEQTGRSARLIEIDPHYCDVIIRRFQKLTGESATLVGTDGLTFDELSLKRTETELNTERA